MAGTRQRAAEEILDAFIELMAEKPFIDITVTDVVKRAGVARASFYRNFSSTGDLLDTVLNQLIEQFKTNILPILASQNEREWRAFLFRYIYYLSDNHQKLFSAMNPNVPLVLYRLADSALELSKTFQYVSVKDKYSSSARFGVINNTLVRWIKDGQKETPEELVDYLMSFILRI